MTKIYSRLNPDKLLHMIVRAEDIPEGRTNLCPNEQFLQCAALRLDKGVTFKAHRHKDHVYVGPYHTIAQESWFVVKGLVKFMIYDTDGTLLDVDTLEPGEASFTFDGGHNYEILMDDTVVMEYKTGPYIDQEHDKTFI